MVEGSETLARSCFRQTLICLLYGQELLVGKTLKLFAQMTHFVGMIFGYGYPIGFPNFLLARAWPDTENDIGIIRFIGLIALTC